MGLRGRAVLGKLIVLGLAMALAAIPAAAQDDLTQHVSLTNGYSINLPHGWQTERDKDIGWLVFWPEGSTVTGAALDPFELASQVAISSRLDLPGAFNLAYAQMIGTARVPSDNIEPIELGDFEALRVTNQAEYDGETYDELLYFIAFDDATYGMLYFFGFPNALQNQMELMQAIAESFVPASASDSTAASSSGGGNCTVSAPEANSIQLRVGPGFNRASVAFLPGEGEFAVIGTFTTEDGDEWFQLVKDEVAPRSAAAELWVLRDDVNVSGNCDQVAGADAPPVIPISAAPPAGSGDAGSAPAAGIVSPTPGTWTLVYSPQGDASCIGGDNFHYNLADYGDTQTYTGGLTATPDGSSFVFWGVNYIRQPGTNNFRGLATLEDGSVNESFATLTSATSLTGRDIFNQTFDGVQCSATVSFTMRHG